MAKILGFVVVLAAAYLTGTVGAAYGQQRGGATAPNSVGNEAINTAVQGTTGTPNQPGGVGANAAAPANVQVHGTPGRVLNQTGVTGTNRNTTAPRRVNAGSAYASGGATYSTYPTTAGTPGVMPGTYPANVTAATPGYVGRTMPGMIGYNSINPMGTTMTPGYYYAGTAGMPYVAYSNTPGYVYPPYGGPGYGYRYPSSSNDAAPGLGVTYPPAYVAPTESAANTARPAQGRDLGIDQDPVVDSSGRWGMMVTNVYPGTPALRAGLRVGDVIDSINGYRNEKPGDLDRIIARAAPNNQLNMTVKRSIDGQRRAITAQLP